MDECASKSKVTEPTDGASRSQHASDDPQTLSGLPKSSSLRTTYCATVNDRSVDQLFHLQERTPFLYPPTATPLEPYSEIMCRNGRRLLRVYDENLPLRAVILAGSASSMLNGLEWSNPSTTARGIWQ